ncbi:MAG: hypothetical protein J6M92_13095 [Oribacterium sp.]|nr:hypothetical protein [Oribacterium sp.]
MGMNPYIMLVIREEIHPDDNMHYYNELKYGVALMEDGTRIPVDTETEKRKIICSFSVYDFDCSSGGYPMRTYAYVRRDYEEVFKGKRGRGKTFFAILNEMAEELTN